VRRIAGFMTQRLFGLDFVCAATIEDLAASLYAGRDERDAGWRCVVTPNVDHLVRYERHPGEFDVARNASLSLPDGMPIVWAGRLLRRPLRARLAGSDLFTALWPQLATGAVPTVVVASSADTADRLLAEHPTLRCILPPMFDVDDEAAVTGVIDEIVAATEAIGARFVVVGLSMPKHHLIASHLHRRWAGRGDPPTVLLLGASAEFYLGLVRRAPAWMQRAGMEWVYRLLSEPRRLAKRYLVDDVKFLPILWREWRGTRRG